MTDAIEDSRIHFWKKIEDDLGTVAPEYIKNILKLSNMDNPLSIRELSEETIIQLEEFVKKDMQLVTTGEENLQKYYGVFSKNPENFKFIVGDRLYLTGLAKFIKGKPVDYWRIPSTSIQQQSVVSEKRISADHSENHSIAEITDYTELEKKNLQRIVRSFLKKNVGNWNDSFRQLVERNEVIINVKGGKAFDNNQEKYEASLTCPICSDVSFLKKSSEPGSKKQRWIISNFRRHLSSHNGCKQEKHITY